MDSIPSGTICQEALFPQSSIAKPSVMNTPHKSSGREGGPDGGPLGGPLGGPDGGPLGGPDGGPLGGPDGGPLGEPDGGPLGGPDGGPLGGPEGGPLGGPLGGPDGGPLGGPEGGPLDGPDGIEGGVDFVTVGAAAGGVGGVGAVETGVGGGVRAVASTGSSGATLGANVRRSIGGFSSWAGGAETGADRSASDAFASVLDFSQGGVLGPSSSTFANELIFVEPPSEFSPKNVLI